MRVMGCFRGCIGILNLKLSEKFHELIQLRQVFLYKM